ncbi:unnamed protein product [Linum trigynum]|uniref:Uncharacterized protein n=1 Tax=Linum trigynum TaxID=586398 RepID=A0AAV2FYJ1_9ROSI
MPLANLNTRQKPKVGARTVRGNTSGPYIHGTGPGPSPTTASRPSIPTHDNAKAVPLLTRSCTPTKVTPLRTTNKHVATPSPASNSPLHRAIDLPATCMEIDVETSLTLARTSPAIELDCHESSLNRARTTGTRRNAICSHIASWAMYKTVTVKASRG